MEKPAMKRNLRLKYSFILIVILLIIAMVLTACGSDTYTIGVVNSAPGLVPVFDGFKAGMAELGYVEGENITYIYKEVGIDNESTDREIKSLMTQKVDLFLTLGTTHRRAKLAVEGTQTPVLFAAAIDPVGQGLVKSIRQPGGNLTGVQSGTNIPKSLEWLLKLVPGTEKVYVPYNPDEPASLSAVTSLQAGADAIGVEMVFEEVRTPETIVAAIKTLPKDTAVYIVPTSGNVNDIIQAAIEHGTPTGAYMVQHVQAGALFNYSGNLPAMGKQTARMADQIFKGVKPSDLPVETAEYFLTINLKTAQAIGLNIPDEILRQADTIVR
jgi:putative ABC transport system substrate-binding protein